mmetsp:Transcript_32486/g.103582  ORF Transcript_32486/g.103582 Transcript_32486/m.103582 type:complete len:235 (-) Transcript_32486:1565-2269(-)
MVFRRRLSDRSSQSPLEARDLGLGIFEVLLDLAAEVEDGAVGVGAEDILVEGALAALALCPEFVECYFVVVEVLEALEEEVAFLGFAVVADGAGGDDDFTAEALEGLGGEHHDGALPGDGGRLADDARMVSSEDGVGVFDDRFEDARQRFRELVVEVVRRVDGEVVFEDVDGVLGLFKGRGALGPRDDYVGNAVADVRGSPRVALLHFFRELGVGLLCLVVAGVRVLREGLGDD